MPADVWVENHQPVPLAPLAELGMRRGSIVFIGKRVVRRPEQRSELAETNGQAGPDLEVFEGAEAPGWVIFDGRDGFRAADDPTDCWYDDALDRDRSLGRLLQPGESLHVRFTNG
jgi:hypothetical protein